MPVDSPAPLVLPYTAAGCRARAVKALWTEESSAKLGQYPSSAVGSPHLFRKVAVPGICVAC